MAVTVLGLADLGCVQASAAADSKPDLGLQAVSLWPSEGSSSGFLKHDLFTVGGRSTKEMTEIPQAS